MTTVREEIEDSAVQVLKTNDPKLFETIEKAICQDGLTPKQIDQYIKRRFGLKKGHPVRDMCYLASISIKRNSASTKICPSCGSNGKDDLFCFACKPEKFS